MTRDTEKLLDQALQLSAEARAELAGRLLESLEKEEASLSDQAYEAAWAAELERRMADMDSGRVKMHSVEESLRRVASVRDDDDR